MDDERAAMRSVFGISILLGSTSALMAHEAGCRKMELLAIDDGNEYAAKLVKYYTRLGFETVRVVGENGKVGARVGGRVLVFFRACHGVRHAGREVSRKAHTFASDVALAVQEGPPIPPVRAGPIHGMGEAAHSRVHAPSGQLNVRRVCGGDENRIPCARMSCEPPNTCTNDSSSREDCGDMRRALGRGCIETQHTWLFECIERLSTSPPYLSIHPRKPIHNRA